MNNEALHFPKGGIERAENASTQLKRLRLKSPNHLNLRANEIQCQLVILNISREALDFSFILMDSKGKARR